MASLIHFRKQSEREFDSVSFTGMVCFTHGQSINKNSPPPLLLFCFCAARLYTSYAGRLRMYIYIYIYGGIYGFIASSRASVRHRDATRRGWGGGLYAARRPIICCATTKNIFRIYIVFSLRPPPTNENAPLLPLCCPIFQLCHSISLIEARSLPFDEPTFASPLSRTRPNR